MVAVFVVDILFHNFHNYYYCCNERVGVVVVLVVVAVHDDNLVHNRLFDLHHYPLAGPFHNERMDVKR